MASSTGHPGAVSRETYWKRRAFVLVGIMLVLTVITVITRACGPADEEGGTPTRSEAGIGEEASPSVAPEEPSATESGEPEAEESEGAEESPGSSDGEDSEGDEGSEGAGGADGEVSAPERPEDVCRPQDVVVTFDFAVKDQEVYGAGSNPGFKITVVNTGEQTCTVDVGGESMEVRIHSGDDRIFSTADCLKGESAQKRQISRGVPHEYTVNWERERSFKDCGDSASTAKPGWYRANLHGDYAGDPSQLVFQLKA